MKLPPIWAEFALFRNLDETNSKPPIPAESTKKKARIEAILTLLLPDQRKENARTTTERTKISIPSKACQIRKGLAAKPLGRIQPWSQ